MKKLFITLAITISAANFCANAQVVGQDAEGFSTIILPSSNLYFDVTDPKASFSFYKETWQGDKPFNDLKADQLAFNDKNLFTTSLTQAKIDKVKTFLKTSIWDYNKKQFNSSNRAKYFILGGEISGGISNGLSTLFSGGEFSTSNTLTGYIGHNWSKLKYKENDASIDSYITSNIDYEKNVLKLSANQKIISSEINKLVRLGILNPEKKDYYNNYNTGDKTSDIKGLKVFIKDITEEQAQVQVVDLKTLIAALEKVKSIAIKNKLTSSKIVLRDKLDGAETELAKANADLKKARDDVKIPGSPTTVETKNITDKNNAKTKTDNALKKLKIDAKNNISNKKDIETKTGEIHKKLMLVPVVGNTIMTDINTTISNDHYNTEKWDSVIKLLNKKLDLLEYSDDNTNPSNFNALIAAYSGRIDLLEKGINDYEVLVDNLNEIKYFTRTILYARGGYNGASFKLDRMNDATTIDERFRDVKFDGYTIQLGVTHQYRVYNYLGFSASLSRAYNPFALKSRTFKLTTEDTTIMDGTFSSSQEITALTGTYDSFLRFSFSADYVHLFSLKESLNPNSSTGTSHLYLSLNPYIRHHGYKRSETIKNNTILGLGLHAFNSNDNKLMGGVFVQTNDTFGANKGTPNALGNRFTFGLIAKFGFTGLKPKASE
ncbi:hypothetical protein [Ulvibacter antarcticus]|uniref:DUF5723 domain-containing protein n=1 Tax=Ulvibacter antarcticus TaxID=442714 RepID=A0A3L9YZ09_9FLAO|nr:hypothetical protein [Ulvibacter antarcticus]RMA64309.1 hypothetical protein BXY75_1182 [Ulvibacter antarcticus]